MIIVFLVHAAVRSAHTAEGSVVGATQTKNRNENDLLILLFSLSILTVRYLGLSGQVPTLAGK